MAPSRVLSFDFSRIMTVTSADEFYSIMGVLTREMLEFTDTNNLIKVCPYPCLVFNCDYCNDFYFRRDDVRVLLLAEHRQYGSSARCDRIEGEAQI